MLYPVSNAYGYRHFISTNKYKATFGISYKTEMNYIIQSEKLPVKKAFMLAKENISTKINKFFTKKTKTEKLPFAEKPLTAEMALENKDKFIEKLGEETLRNSHYGPGFTTYSDTDRLLSGLPKDFIPNKPWDGPMTDSGHLTNTAKETIIKNIENSNMSSYDKEKYIKQIKSNYIDESGHNDVISFGDYISEKDMTDIQSFGGLKNSIDSHGLDISDFDISDTLHDHLDTGVGLLDHTENIIEHGIDTIIETLGHITDTIL